MVDISAMAIRIEDARRPAAWLSLLAGVCVSGCLSTSGEALFEEDVAPLAMAPAMTSIDPDAMPEAGAPAAVMNMPFLPEQSIGAARDIAPAGGAAAAGGGSAPAAEAAPAPSVAEEAAADPCAQNGMLFCDGFEAQADEAFPADGGWLPELAGCGTHRVDGAGPAASGSKALRVDEGGYPECMLHAELSGEPDVFVRTRVFIGAQLAGAEGALLDQYVSLLELGTGQAQDDPELRVGLRPTVDSLCPGVPGIDVSGSGLMGGPATQCTGVVLEPERWYCMQAHFTRSERNLSVSVALDGMDVVAADFVGGAAWGGNELYVKLGRAAYGPSGPGSLWHDDVAISREPLPCAP